MAWLNVYFFGPEGGLFPLKTHTMLARTVSTVKTVRRMTGAVRFVRSNKSSIFNRKPKIIKWNTKNLTIP